MATTLPLCGEWRYVKPWPSCPDKLWGKALLSIWWLAILHQNACVIESIESMRKTTQPAEYQNMSPILMIRPIGDCDNPGCGCEDCDCDSEHQIFHWCCLVSMRKKSILNLARARVEAPGPPRGMVSKLTPSPLTAARKSEKSPLATWDAVWSTVLSLCWLRSCTPKAMYSFARKLQKLAQWTPQQSKKRSNPSSKVAKFQKAGAKYMTHHHGLASL